MHTQTHAQVQQAHKLAVELTSVITSTRDTELQWIPKSKRTSGKSRKEGGAQIPITKLSRKLAEKAYRGKAARQTRKAIFDEGAVVDDISRCEWWHWRW